MRAPRLFGWLIATFLLLIAIALLAPQQLPVSLYKLSLVSMAGVAGYWLDRSLFPYARPDSFVSEPGESIEVKPPIPGVDAQWLLWDCGTSAGLLFGLAMLRRAVIVGCAMLAISGGA